MGFRDASTAEATFLVQRCGGQSCSNFATLASVTSSTRSGTGTVYTYIDRAGLVSGTSYSYRAAACSSAGACGSFSRALPVMAG